MKPSPEKWSKKEIPGHLFDSATNNHHRLVRGQFENQPTIAYDNRVWNSGNHYQITGPEELIACWATYNRYLLALVKHIPKENLSKPWQPENRATMP